MEFEWDEAKAESNIKKHKGITFEDAALVFYDEWGIQEFDAEHSDFVEERFIIIGLSGMRILRVSYTLRENFIRIISAEKARPYDLEAYKENRNKYD